MKIIRRTIRGCWYYFWGHIFAFLFYDKKYLKGKWFKGRMNGLCAEGWVWVTKCALQRIFLNGCKAQFPISYKANVLHPENIVFDPDNLDNFQSPGTYYQALGRIHIGRGTYIAPNVGLITSNHDLYNLDKHYPPKEIMLGKSCWIGMNSMVLGGVELGDHTIVGAGSVVTKSFPEGYCVIAGNPAK